MTMANHPLHDTLDDLRIVADGADASGDAGEAARRDAHRRGVDAFERLLALAERSDSGQARRVARFVAGLYNGEAFPFDLFELRVVDVAIGDDMLRCLDAHRWAVADLHSQVSDGDRRVRRMIEAWGMTWPA
jgi:hypothetical protein